jgi:hypothetical protein
MYFDFRLISIRLMHEQVISWLQRIFLHLFTDRNIISQVQRQSKHILFCIPFAMQLINDIDSVKQYHLIVAAIDQGRKLRHMVYKW